ncbi:uncharacterized protein Triagg1_743 [Trichoderma aggressivum f. europaeum]|uniref:CENP-V/GFA domain-containing protein n=1 Tax=Trichoderma aggressivum f. europaeum TaxID=173218 RepID=A0AAE1IJ24_9HYPO|nr:hypothetical protein Triagg1_743 [Trichoderma aggressivum f. europaeum]
MRIVPRWLAQGSEFPRVRIHITPYAQVPELWEMDSTGSTYTANAVVPEASFKVTKGEPKFYDTIGDSGKKNRHFFCGNCGSPLFNKLDVMPGEVIIKSGGLDNGAADLKTVGVEFFCEQRLSFVPPAEGAKQLPRFG